MNVWFLSVPSFPVPASRPRLSRGRKPYYAKTYTAFKGRTPKLVRVACSNAGLHRPLDGELAVAVRIVATRPKSTILTRPKPDVDNFAKAVLDACNGIVWHDDDQVVDLHIIKQWSDPGQPGYFELAVKKNHVEHLELPGWAHQ